MFRLFLASSFLALVSAVEFKNSAIITSADVQAGSTLTFSTLKIGDAYRVYATFASGSSEDYAKNVFVTDNSGASFNVAGLARAKPGTDYILDDLRLLRAPITVQDKNAAGAARVPFTVYVVNADITRFPVVSAQLASLDVDSSKGFLAAGVTILSAEKYFTMYNFDIGSMSSMYISSVGYDEFSTEFQVMTIYSPSIAHLSFLSVYGPVATLFNSNFALNARFTMKFTKNTKYDYSLSPGASFSLLSPGYLSKTQSYKIAYDVPEALDRAYLFPEDNLIQLDMHVRDMQSPEKFVLKVTGHSAVFDDLNIVQDTEQFRAVYASGVAITLQDSVPQHKPRFLIGVTSGAPFTFSLISLLLITFFQQLN